MTHCGEYKHPAFSTQWGKTLIGQIWSRVLHVIGQAFVRPTWQSQPLTTSPARLPLPLFHGGSQTNELPRIPFKERHGVQCGRCSQQPPVTAPSRSVSGAESHQAEATPSWGQPASNSSASRAIEALPFQPHSRHISWTVFAPESLHPCTMPVR